MMNLAPAYIDITFEKGIATHINGKEFSEKGINNILSTIANEYGLEDAYAILKNAEKALKENSGCICMKLFAGTATPFAA